MDMLNHDPTDRANALVTGDTGSARTLPVYLHAVINAMRVTT